MTSSQSPAVPEEYIRVISNSHSVVGEKNISRQFRAMGSFRGDGCDILSSLPLTKGDMLPKSGLTEVFLATAMSHNRKVYQVVAPAQVSSTDVAKREEAPEFDFDAGRSLVF